MTTQSTDSGQAANYYDARQTFDYSQQPGPTRPPPAMGHDGTGEPKVYPQSGNYAGGVAAPAPAPGPGQAPPYNAEVPGDEKHTFSQAFKIQKPKFNDLWAGILVSFLRCHCHFIFLPFPIQLHARNG
jgi:hypothetical protein